MISKDQKENIICTLDECGETFYGRHTAQHPAAVITNNNKSLDPLRAKKTFIRKKLGHTKLPEEIITLQNVYTTATGQMKTKIKC